MHRKTIGQVVTLALSVLLSTGTFHSAFADDTEIFFGGQASSDVIAPNVLFVLDNSGSMNESICASDDPECWADRDRYSKTRMEALQESFENLMNTTRSMSINAGLLRFHNNNRKYTNQEIYHEVLNLEAYSGTNPLIVSSPSAGPGDADERHADKQVDTDELFVTVGGSLRDGFERHPLTIPYNNQHIAREENGQTHIARTNLRFYYGTLNAYHFEGFSIPKGATILSARLELYSSSASSWEASSNEVEITADSRIGRPLNISGTGQLSARLAYQIPSSNRVAWQLGNNRVGSTNWFQSPDISSVVQAVVDSNSSTSVDSMTLLFRELSYSHYLSTSGDTTDGKKPRLSVSYINNDPNFTPVDHSAGFRFTNIDVPQGSTITKATLRLTPENSNNSTPTFIVRAEDTGHASEFSATNGDISNRPLTTASSTWQLTPWERTNNDGDINSYEVDVTTVMQEVVNHDDWCGGKAAALILTPAAGSTGYREIASEDAASPPPVLDIQVAPGTESSLGCQTKTLTYPIVDRINDAETFHRTNGDDSTNLTTAALDLARADIGLRYNHFPLLKDAEIEEAYIEFTAYDHFSHDLNLRISAHDVVNSSAFTEAEDSLTSRTETSARIDWNLTEDRKHNNTFRTPDISGALEEVVAQDGWAAGNSLSLLIKPRQNYSHTQRAYAWDGSPTHAPRLVIKLAADQFDSDSARPRVRNQLTSFVKDLRPGGGTPALDALVRAQNYLTGASTPIKQSCQSNHIVLLSDGQPNSFSQSHANAITNLTGDTCVYNSSVAGQTLCARNLTEWMESNDMLSSLDGKNVITTHTIGFAATNQAEKFLKDIASPGDNPNQKRFYEANDSASLTTAFGSILQEILSIEASFNSASISVNQYRSYQHNNELYYALFTPSKKTNWTGNLKKYRLGTETKTVNGEEETTYFLTAKGKEKAVDPETGAFKDGTRSFWSKAPDGNRTDLGGAASRLPKPSNRNIYTDTTLNRNGNLTNEPLRTNNASITKALLGNSQMDNAERENIIQWARGVNTNDPERPARQQIGDPLHSQPALVSYGCRTYVDSNDKSQGCTKDGEDITIYFGTNQGFLHAITGHTGKEAFAYIPEELLPNLRQYVIDPEVGNGIQKPYGLDGSPVVWRLDNNKNGAIEPNKGDRVYLYFGMRRGGNNYYALDVTDRSSPKLLWKIDANSTGMGRLAQTWSKPSPTRILLNGAAKRVLVFGGGYDPSNDTSGTVRDADIQGNAVYIVDADTGAMLWRAGSDSQASLTLDKMDYSIPGEIVILDLNLDGFGDQMVFADMGGQIWRLFIDQQQSRGGNQIVVTPFGGTGSTDARGVVADLGTSQEEGNRRFYMRPVTGLTNAGYRKLFTIGIGSGYRAHPLDKTVDDRFYVLKSEAVFDNPLSTPTLTEANLYDATDNKVQAGNANEIAAAQNALALIPTNSDGSAKTDSNGAPLPPLNNGGWYIRLVEDGEKALSDIALIDGYFSFATYEPATQAHSCKAVQGVNRYYRVNAADGTGVDGQRKTIVQNTGIISSTRLVVVNRGELDGGTGSELVTLEGVGTSYHETQTGEAIRQTGWIDRKTQ